jgi:hypothetical protein
MTVCLTDEELRSQFINICKKFKLADPNRTTYTQNGAEVPILQLDTLWHHYEALNAVSKLSITAIKSCAELKIDSIDAIVGITSRLGSFGPLPFLSPISLEFKIDLAIASETSMGEYVLYPIEIAENGLRNKKILLFKDGIIRGTSLTRVSKLISSLKGKIAGILVFVDVDNPEPDAEKIVQDCPTIEFLHGNMITSILSK